MILQPGDVAIDYSFARPAPLAIVGAGVRLVVRYISPTRSNKKNLTAVERDGLLAAGLSVMLVWEAVATDPLRGATVGQQHGSQAGVFAHDLGYPTGFPIIAAVDFQVIGQQITPVMEYLAAFQGACGYPMGVYGNDTMVTAAHDAGVSVLGWQTRAWSHGRLSPFADVRQEIGVVHPPVAVLGSVDDNTVLRPFAAWSTTDAPLPPPSRPPVSEESDMPHFVVDETGDIWLDDIDWQANEFADTVGNLGIDWRLWDLPGLPVRQRSLLEAKRAVRSRPVPPPGPQVVVPVADHLHIPGGVAQ